MMKAPRRALSGLVVVLAVSLSVSAQDAKAIDAEIQKLEAKVKEEVERTARKKESIQVEFAALQRPETKEALQAKLAGIGAKHRPALGSRPESGQGDAASRPVPESVRNAVREDCRAALAGTVGRNLAAVLDGPLATNLVELLRGDAPVDYQMVLTETLDEVFDGPDFEANYRKLVPTVEKTLLELNAEVARLRQRRADLETEARARTLGIPAGMVLVPGGKYRIGSDTTEFEAIRKVLRYGPDEGNIDKYALGWPAHEVTLDDFYIDVNEVPNRYWAEYVRDTGIKPPKYWTEKKREQQKKKEKKAQAIAEPNGNESAPPPPKPADDSLVPEGMEDFPVTFVTIDEVMSYLEWCGRRLPTEFEWEAAARYRSPGDKSARWWTWGDTYDLTKAMANNQTAAAHPRRDPESQLMPIGTFPEGRSALGINDLVGNAAEMTASYFTPYPGWQETKVPSSKGGKQGFDANLPVLRGGTARAPELYTLTTTRTPMSKGSAELVGFRTALSKARGKDFIQSVAGGTRLAASLEAIGPAFKDEKSGRPQLATDDPTRYTALMAGGWDPERKLPARAHHVAIVCRDTLEFADATRIKSIAREKKKPVMLGYLHTAVALTRPEAPKGAYWIMWSPGRTKMSGSTKLAMPEGFVLQSVTKPDEIFDIPNVNPPVIVPKSTEYTKLTPAKSGDELDVLMSFPVGGRKESRFFVEFQLATEPGALASFK